MSYSAALVQRGGRITYTNSTGSDIASKQVVRLATGLTGFIGITVDAIANSSSGEVSIGAGADGEGVWNLPKKSGDVFTVGQLVYWDNSNSWLTSTATGTFTRAGRCTKAAASAATTADCKINVP